MVKSRIKIYVYTIRLPDGIKEAVLSCAEGYTIYIDDRLDEEQRQKAFIHAMKHIERDDFHKDDVQEIEAEVHSL